MKEFKVILFDGECNLCNSSIQFVIKNDKNNRFKFASLQSEFGQNFLLKNNLDVNDFDSIVLIDRDKYYTKSSAALSIAKNLGGIYSLLSVFFILPKFIRDYFYSIVANNRYKWFGKTDSCWLPTAELKSKFL